MSPTPTRTESEREQRRQRAELLRRRRRAGLRQADAARPNTLLRTLPTVGLALSGGGIRSATYSLGVLRGLAQRGLLARVDCLSTVSGGGYVGAMFGRLVSALGIEEAQRMLAARRSPLLDWLRANGRYLTPAGARDLMFAAVTYLRAFVAMHGELMLACVLFGLVVTFPHLWQLHTRLLEPNGWAPWMTLWWPLAAAWGALTLPGMMSGYWLAREGPDPTRPAQGLAARDLLYTGFMTGLAAALTWLAWRLGLLRGFSQGPDWTPFALLALWSLVLGPTYTLLRLARTPDTRALAVAKLRNRYTEALAWALRIFTGLVLLGALDRASWWALELALTDRDWLWGGIGLGGAAALLLRSLAQPLQQLVSQPRGSLAAWGPRLLNLAGIGGMLLVLCFWVTAVQWLVFTPQPFDALEHVPAHWRALAMLAWCLGWWGLTSANEGMANASSLHSFYRARLVRAYLSVGNPLRPVLQPQAPAPGEASDVRQVVPHDDTDLRSYRPEQRGGPVHLVNCCLNQTRDDASGLFNADRKGTLLTVHAAGMEIGARERLPYAAATEAGTLGRWVAISGAAAAPGAGSYTTRGWALLLFMIGVRLGHWVRAPSLPPAPPGAWWPMLWEVAVKPAMLWSEASATFFGRARPWWYLSDGGHFENTGVYALLKRRLDFIVLVDGSADGRYEFADLENLVRKARIDLGVEIEFYRSDEALQRFGLHHGACSVLSPEELADNQSARGVLMARVRYPDAGPGLPAHHGTLLVLKPSLHAALDVDVLAYAQRSPDFPHESTGDQFFDEAQWESYHRLGEDMASALDESWLGSLPGWAQAASLDLDTPARLRQPATGPLPPGKEPAWRRAARNTALGTTLGVGASGTLIVSMWQVGEQLRQNEATQRAELRQIFTEVSKALSAQGTACPAQVPAHLTMQLTLLRDLSGSPVLLPLERASVQQMLERTRDQCRRQSQAPSADCPDTSAADGTQGVCAVVSKPLQATDALSYWHPLQAPSGRLFTFGTAWQAFQDLWAREGGDTTLADAGTLPEPAPAAAPPSPLPDATASAPAQPAASAPPPVSACGSAQRPVRLYIQVYDEASRARAELLRSLLQQAGGDGLKVAAPENVVRTAELRQQRKPVPWPRPTFITHRVADEGCARALATLVRSSWPNVGRRDRVWVNDLPKSLGGQDGVIELWLPPSQNNADGGS